MGTFDKNLLDQKFEASEAELFEGFGLALLITAFDRIILEQISIEFCAQSSLAFLGVEAGVQCFISPQTTPDKREGIVISIWVKKSEKSEDYGLKKLYKHLDRRIKTVLFPYVGIRVFNHYPASSQILVPFNSEKGLSEFGGEYSRVLQKFEREMCVIPMMGGDFEIEKYLYPRPGFLGGNLWVFHTLAQNAYAIVHELKSKMLDCVDISTIFINNGAGSGIPPLSPVNKGDDPLKIMSNLDYAPSLKNSRNLKIANAIESITEIVINGFSLDKIKVGLAECIKILVNNKNISKIRLGSYDGSLGDIKITHSTLLETMNEK